MSGGSVAFFLRQPLLAGRDVDLMLKIIVRNFPFRSRHGGSDGRSHRREIKPTALLFLRRSGGLAETALDVGIGDRAGRPAAGDC